jgi:hypothetical protein
MTRPAAYQGNAALAGQTTPGIGHVHGRRLVAHVQQAQLRAEHGIENRHDVVARQGENLRTARQL